MSLILGKRVPFFLENVSSLEKRGIFQVIFTGKGVFCGASSQRFLKKGVFISPENISERGHILI